MTKIIIGSIVKIPNDLYIQEKYKRWFTLRQH